MQNTSLGYEEFYLPVCLKFCPQNVCQSFKILIIVCSSNNSSSFWKHLVKLYELYSKKCIDFNMSLFT